MMKNLMRSCSNFKELYPCRILNILHFKSYGYVVAYVRHRKSRMKRVLVIRHGNEIEKKMKMKKTVRALCGR